MLFSGSNRKRGDFVQYAMACVLSMVVVSAFACVLFPSEVGAYATIEGPPKFSTAPGLPDGRVYEQVSPADKNGNTAGATTNPFETGAADHWGYAAGDGNSVLFEGTGPMGESPSPANLMFVAQRSSAGWRTRALEPARRHEGKDLETLEGKDLYVDPSADLSHAVVMNPHGTLASSLPNEECVGQLYLTGPTPLVAATWLEQPEVENPVTNCSTQTNFSGAPAGGNSDFSTVYFTYSGTLLPADASRAPHAGTGEPVEAWGFYEDHEGELREAGVLPDQELDPFGAVPAASLHGIALSGNQVSSDGSRAFFVSPDPASCKENGGHNDCATDPPELYVRENGERTLLVSRDALLPATAGGLPAAAPAGSLRMPNADSPFFSGSYVFASPDGSQAFFQSTDDLTEGALHAAPGTEPKTYGFDVNTGELTYLPGVAGEIVATDTDGSVFAFVRPAAGGEPAQLDLWSDAQAGHVTPVTQLRQAIVAGGPDETASVVRISSDGSVLVFETSSLLSGAFNSGGVNQVYRYDVSANTLGCVSCPPQGIVPSGPASMSTLRYEERGGEVFGEASNGRAVVARGISADGQRIFFDTPDPLAPQDTNTNSPEVEVAEATKGRQGRDVYEWENGVVYLISGGKSPRNSILLDSSDNGDDVFFATPEGLVPGDTDGGYDVYDARVPRETPTPAAVPCEGAVCQGPPRVESPLAPPARATLPGSDNLAPEPAAAPPPPKQTTTKTLKCKRGQVKKKNQCVKGRRPRSPRRGGR